MVRESQPAAPETRFHAIGKVTGYQLSSSIVQRNDSWISLTDVSGGNPPLKSSFRPAITRSPDRPSAMMRMSCPS